MTDNRPRRGLILQNLLQVALLLLAPAAFSADLPKSVPVYEFVQVTLNPDETALVIRDGLLPVATIETKDGIAFTGPPGRYLVALITPGKATPEQNFVEIVGVVPPPPKPPAPDVVPPTPDVVPPTPDTDKAPLPGLTGFKVLLIYESADLPPKVPAAQYDIRVDPRVTGWLTANTTPEDGWAGWRVGDPQSGVAQGSMHWEKMLSFAKSTPWVVINNGTRNVGYSGPLPANADDFVKLVEKYK